MATTLNVIITDAGIQEVINAEHDGTAPVRLAQVGFGRGIYTPSASQTELQDEIKRVDTIAGGVVGGNVMHIQALDGARDAAYAVYEIGVYTESGTLFAVYSQALPIIYKVADSEIMCVIDFVLAGFEPTSVTVGDTNYTLAPATTSNQGVVELATNEEAVAGTDAERALTPASGAAAIDDKVAAHAALIATSGKLGHFSFVASDLTPFMVAGTQHTINSTFWHTHYTSNDGHKQSLRGSKAFNDLYALDLTVNSIAPAQLTLITGSKTGSSDSQRRQALCNALGVTLQEAAVLDYAIAQNLGTDGRRDFVVPAVLTEAQKTSLAVGYNLDEGYAEVNLGNSGARFDHAWISNLRDISSIDFSDSASDISFGLHSSGYTVGDLICTASEEDRAGNIRLYGLNGGEIEIYIAEAATHAVAMDDSSTGVNCPVGSIAFVCLAKNIKARGVSVEIGETFSVSATGASVAELTSSGFSTGARYLPAGTYKAFCKITFTGEAASFTQPIFVQRVG